MILLKDYHKIIGSLYANSSVDIYSPFPYKIKPAFSTSSSTLSPNAQKAFIAHHAIRYITYFEHFRYKGVKFSMR